MKYIFRQINQHKLLSKTIEIIPGLIIIGATIIARLLGTFQFVELLTYDSFLRLRPSEPTDERITIVGINERDIQNIGYPVPDRTIARLIKRLQDYNPRAIGLDLIRDIAIEPGSQELIAAFKTNQNLISVEKVLPEQFAPPPASDPDRIGFVDVLLDLDGRLRRSLLGTPNPKDLKEYKYSFTLRLAQAYLKPEKINLTNGIRDPQTMRFDTIEFPRFRPNFGSYVGEDANGVQVLINFRSGPKPFRLISLSQFEKGDFDPSWLRDRIIIIGITSPSVKDYINTSVIASTSQIPNLAYGVEIQAHAISQAIDAVLDGRTLLNVWPDWAEYLWILGWGILGICSARLIQSPLSNLLIMAISSFILVATCYLVLLWGWWIPVFPAGLVFVLNGLGLSPFYQYIRTLKSHIKIQKSTIERTFENIHNGPLQTLKSLIRNVQDEAISQEELLSRLWNLDDDLRKLHQFLEEESLNIEASSIVVGNNVKLDLNMPIHNLLYLVYRHTLARNLLCFETIKVKIPKFNPISSENFNIEQKREICLFLEEALCNVGKHATGVTRLKVIFTEQKDWLLLRIEDNGQTEGSFSEGQGTKNAKKLARQLKGKFRREPLAPQGMLCELTWPTNKFWLISILSRLRTFFTGRSQGIDS